MKAFESGSGPSSAMPTPILMADTAPEPTSWEGLAFLKHCYRFARETWQHAPRDETPDQGFESLFRAKSVEQLTGWTVSQHREMGFGVEAQPASGVLHELDLVASTDATTAVAELKKRQDVEVGKNDVIVFWAKLVDYFCSNPFILLKDVYPVFLTSLSFEMSGLAACLGLGIHPVSPYLRPYPYLARCRDIMTLELAGGLTVGERDLERYLALDSGVRLLGEEIESSWVGERFIHLSDQRIGVVAAPPPAVHEAAQELITLNSLASDLILAFQAAKARSR